MNYTCSLWNRSTAILLNRCQIIPHVHLNTLNKKKGVIPDNFLKYQLKVIYDIYLSYIVIYNISEKYLQKVFCFSFIHA